MITRRKLLKGGFISIIGSIFSFPGLLKTAEKKHSKSLHIFNPEAEYYIKEMSDSNDLIFSRDEKIIKIDIVKGQETLLTTGDNSMVASRGKIRPYILPDKLKSIWRLWLSPDGDKATFAANSSADNYSGRGLYLYDFSTGRTICLIHPKGLISVPAFSNDGNKIAFYYSENFSAPYRGGDWSLHIVNSDGTGHKVIAPSSQKPEGWTLWPDWARMYPPLWNPDNKTIYFQAKYGNRQEKGLDNIYRISLNGGEPQFVNTGFPEAVSSDGAIIFGTDVVNNVSKVFSMNADGTNRQFIIEGYRPVVLSPDGNYLAFYRQDSLSIIRTDGTGLKRLCKFTIRLNPMSEKNVFIWGGSQKIHTRFPIERIPFKQK